MKLFTELYLQLDQTTRTSGKVDALVRYFRTAPPIDAAWAVFVLSGRKIGKAVNSRLLREWAAEASGYSGWLVDQCYSVVGDLSETLSLLVPAPAAGITPPALHEIVEEVIKVLPKVTQESQRKIILDTWAKLTADERFVFHKLLSVNFRVGVSKLLLTRALAEVAGVEQAVMAHRLAGNWMPDEQTMPRLLGAHDPNAPADHGVPYPFMLANPLAEPVSSLGPIEDWLIEWKWDGIRAQLIRRGGRAMLWSRGDEIVSGAFPEIINAACQLPDGCVLDGEIVAWDDAKGRPLPFTRLQRRLNRQNFELTFWPEIPVTFIAFDILEMDGKDLRAHDLRSRRELLGGLIRDRDSVLVPSPLYSGERDRVRGGAGNSDAREKSPSPQPSPLGTGEREQDVASSTRDESRPRAAPGFGAARFENVKDDPHLRLSSPVRAASWEEAASLMKGSRERAVEGLMLKRWSSSYLPGRPAGLWWKLKVEPYTMDAVMIAAEPGHGRRAGLLTDYTFGVWDGVNLVPITKAYSGLTDDELAETDRFARRHTISRHGPVHLIEPLRVFEIAFEAIQASTRHKSGIAVRFPRILRIRVDKKPAEADTLQTMRALLDQVREGIPKEKR